MTHLYIIEGSDGQCVALGPVQTMWLERGGFVERTEHPELWRALHGLTHQQIHEMVLAQPELRECDFCREIPAGWRINCRPFALTLGPNAGARLGGPDRPLFACDVCVRYVRENRKDQLVEYVIAATVEKAKTLGDDPAARAARSQPWPVIKKHLAPTVREVVYGMFGHRIGFPERDVDPNDERTAA
jgi:hypothetical protein